MKSFIITEAQLNQLQALVWGARFTKPGEAEGFNELIYQIKTQPLETE